MYDFYYNYIKKNDAKLLFTDTDRLTYKIKTEEDIYNFFYKDKDLFDFSNYSKDSKFFLIFPIGIRLVKWKMSLRGK